MDRNRIERLANQSQFTRDDFIALCRAAGVVHYSLPGPDLGERWSQLAVRRYLRRARRCRPIEPLIERRV